MVRRLIRPLTEADLPQAAALYKARMASSTYAALGEDFVRELLGALATSPGGYVVVDAGDERVDGFIAATTDTAALFRHMRRKHGLSLIRAAGLRLLNPRLLLQLGESGSYFKRVGLAHVPAELLYIAVRDDYVGRKRSSRLLAAMLDLLHRQGATAVKVTTVKDNEPPQRLLEAFGFTRRGEFSFYGKKMVAFVHNNLAEARRETF